MGIFMRVSSVAILLTSVVMGLFISPNDDLQTTQNVLTFSIVPCCLLTSFCYFMSGFDYEKRMNTLREERTKSLA